MKIGDKTMIQHVYENCATILDHLVVATDDQRIFDAVEAFNGNAIMTKAHLTGTDRCLEAVNLWEENQNKTFPLVINIQGDEPFIHEDHLSQLMSCLMITKLKLLR